MTGCSAANWKARDDGPRAEPAFAVQRRLARARPCVPVPADRDPRDLFVQRLAAGHGMGRLVAALVFGILQRPRHAGSGVDEFPRGYSIGHDRDAAWHAGRDSTVARPGLWGPNAVFRHALCAAG